MMNSNNNLFDTKKITRGQTKYGLNWNTYPSKKEEELTYQNNSFKQDNTIGHTGKQIYVKLPPRQLDTFEGEKAQQAKSVCGFIDSGIISGKNAICAKKIDDTIWTRGQN